MHYGGDYNPEQWPREVWREDVARMQEAGVTMVSVGIFSWARISPREGVFDLDWLDEVVDLLHEGGIAVDLATATASPPPWVTSRYPGVLAQDADGATYWPGSRQQYSHASADYRRLAAELTRTIAERYADHPAVVMWHVNNEYACHLPVDYSDAAAAGFRAWLRARYGDVDGLNRAWGTAFWSQRYDSLDEVLPPRKAPYSLNPTQLLDFSRYTSDSFLELYTAERDIIRATGATQPITTNFMGAHPPLDYWRWAAEVDVVSDDAYPDPNDPESFRTAAFARDLMRSLKPGTPWLLMEQSTNALNWRPTNAPKAPGQMAALSMQAVARGADGVLFFQWRQSAGGSEKFHSAMLPHAGTRTRTWREVVGLGADLAALPELPAPGGEARVALVLDWDSWWAVENPDHPVVLELLPLVQRWYRALHRRHVMVDLVPPTGDLSAYTLVVLPQTYLLTGEGAANLLAFADRGGHLLVTPFTDVVDSDDRFREGGYLTQLGPALGVWLEDFGALDHPGGTGQSAAPVRATGSDVPGFTGGLFAEEVHVEDVTDPAEVVATFEGGRLHGRPALTRKAVGAGTGWHLATVPDEDGTDALVGWLLEQVGVEPVWRGLPATVEAARRGDVVTLINHGTEPVAVDLGDHTVLAASTELGTGTVELPSFGWVLLRP